MTRPLRHLDGGNAGACAARCLAALFPLLAAVPLSGCASPTDTNVSLDRGMPLAAGESIVLLFGDAESRGEFARCVRKEFTARAGAQVTVLGTGAFQDAMFPWFEPEYAPKTAEDLGVLLARPAVRERIAALNVRYVFDLALRSEETGFPGFVCGGGFGAGGCLGVGWQDRRSELTGMVWDLKRGEAAAGISGASSGRSVEVGVVLPILFFAYTETDACRALADRMIEALGRSPAEVR